MQSPCHQKSGRGRHFQSLVIQTKQNINKGITSIYYLPLHFRNFWYKLFKKCQIQFLLKKTKDSSSTLSLFIKMSVLLDLCSSPSQLLVLAPRKPGSERDGICSHLANQQRKPTTIRVLNSWPLLSRTMK